MPELLLKIYRIFFGALIIVAIGVQFVYSFGKPDFNFINFFSYFTILTNLLAAGLFLLLGLGAVKQKKINNFRGAAVVYLLVTGIVYWLFLANSPEKNQLVFPWINSVLHKIMPVAVFIDWLWDPPKTKTKINILLYWLVFPFIFLGYSLIRGWIINWYPYPFLNLALQGYKNVFCYCLGIFTIISLTALLVIFIGNKLFLLEFKRGKKWGHHLPCDKGHHMMI